jgi:hypothetical protein
MSTTHFQNNVIIDGAVTLAKTGGSTSVGLTDPVVLTQLGQIIVANDNVTSSTTTGSIKTAGGIGVVGNVFVGGTSNVNGTTTMGSSTPVTVGGFGVTTINNVTQSTTTSTGCLQAKGGVGVLKNVYVGGTIVGGNLNTRYTWATSNITAGLSDKVMPLFTAGGSSVNFAPFNSTLTKIYFQMDNETDEFSNWSAGDLSYTLYINETSTAVTDTFTFANKATDWSTDGASVALSEYAYNINSGLSLSVAADDRLMIKFSTTAGWSATGGEISLTAVIEPRI